MAQEPDKHENTVVFLVAPGDVLDDHWLIESRIGQGAMGSVFKGKDTKQPRSVAIKILAPEHCRKPKVLARFEREAKMMSTLRHPNIIQILGVGRRGALPYIVMQLLEGMTLYDVLKQKGGKLTPGETMAVVKQISAGLAFIHHHGLVHRDVKPQNIFVSPGGRVTILDLGVIRDKSNPGLTKPGAMVGTPYYMSPEQIIGTGEIDKRTDVYALAAMTFELLIGRPPFLGTSNFEVLYAHKNNPPPDASTLAKNVSKDAAKALMRAMAKTREERPQSASEFYADLEAYFGQHEKIDPAVAFAFLEEEAEKARQKEKDKAARKEKERKSAPSSSMSVKSTRAQTQPLVRMPEAKRATSASSDIPMAMSSDVESLDPQDITNSQSGPKPDPASDTGEDDELELTARQPGERDPAGDTGHDVEAPDPQEITHRKTSAEDPASDTGDDDREDEEAADVAQTQGVEAAKLPDLRRRDTDETSAPKTGDFAVASNPGTSAPPEATGAGQTVTESGEVRVVTTLKGFTSSCALFIDDRPEGNTPCSVQLPIGRHLLRVERAGFKPLEKQVVVKANEVTLARFELQAPAAK